MRGEGGAGGRWGERQRRKKAARRTRPPSSDGGGTAPAREGHSANRGSTRRGHGRDRSRASNHPEGPCSMRGSSKYSLHIYVGCRGRRTSVPCWDATAAAARAKGERRGRPSPCPSAGGSAGPPARPRHALPHSLTGHSPGGGTRSRPPKADNNPPPRACLISGRGRPSCWTRAPVPSATGWAVGVQYIHTPP